MNSINMKREELIKLVQENRTKHIAAFEEAKADYATAIVNVAKYNLKMAKDTKLVDKQFKSYPHPPKSYENEYTRAESMLRWSVDEVIEVEEHIFNQLVLDEWSWKQSFTATSTLYKTL